MKYIDLTKIIIALKNLCAQNKVEFIDTDSGTLMIHPKLDPKIRRKMAYLSAPIVHVFIPKNRAYPTKAKVRGLPQFSLEELLKINGPYREELESSLPYNAMIGCLWEAHGNFFKAVQTLLQTTVTYRENDLRFPKMIQRFLKKDLSEMPLYIHELDLLNDYNKRWKRIIAKWRLIISK